MSPPLVGVTAWLRSVETHLGPTPMYTIQEPYISSLRAVGAVPLLLMPVPDSDVGPVLELVDGVVLSGGNDMEPSLYGAERHPRSQDPDHERDAFEAYVARHAIELGIPILAICRGMQSLNVVLGGTLHQNVEEHVEGAGDHDRIDARGTLVHEVRLEAGSRLAGIFGTDTISVNSMHHQAVSDVAPGLRVVGRQPDSGLVEAAELDHHPWCVAVQWHPEALTEQHPSQLALFQAFVAAAAAFGRSRPALGT